MTGKISSKNILISLFEEADVVVGGARAWDIQVHDERFFDRVVAQGTLGVGESYMEGWWDCERIDELVCRLMQNDALSKVKPNIFLLASALKGTLFNLQRWRAFEIGRKHYDISNDFYEAMLDKGMNYSCAYWKDAKNLDEAQEAKLELVCRKLGLQKGQHILDIGAGWGSMLKYGAEKHGASGLGVTVSREQAVYANAQFDALPLEVKLMDYRDLEGEFDHLVSIGMFEHVGYKNYREYFKKCAGLLKDDGLFLLHTIGGEFSQNHGDPWVEKYIFPNSMLPSIRQIGDAIEGVFVMEDWHNLGADYDRTLMEWHKNFEAAWPVFKAEFSESFGRMWRFYLLMFAGLFRARKAQVWQIVLSKNGVKGGYRGLR